MEEMSDEGNQPDELDQAAIHSIPDANNLRSAAEKTIRSELVNKCLVAIGKAAIVVGDRGDRQLSLSKGTAYWDDLSAIEKIRVRGILKVKGFEIIKDTILW